MVKRFIQKKIQLHLVTIFNYEFFYELVIKLLEHLKTNLEKILKYIKK